MFEAANIREWRRHDVVDAQGHKIGQLEAIYVDTGTDLPSFGGCPDRCGTSVTAPLLFRRFDRTPWV